MILIILFLSHFWTHAAVAETKPAMKTETKAESLRLAGFKTLEGRFQQSKVLRELDVEIKTSGKFHVAKIQDHVVFHWNVEKPKPSQICVDATGVVIESGEGEQRKKKRLQFSDIGKEAGTQVTSLVRLLTLAPDKAAQDFSVAPLGDRRWALTPKKAGESFFAKAEVHLNKADLIDEMILTETSKDEMKLKFSELKTNSAKAFEKSSCVR